LAAQKSQDKAIYFTQTLFDQAKERNDALESKFDTLSYQPAPLSIETVNELISSALSRHEALITSKISAFNAKLSEHLLKSQGDK